MLRCWLTATGLLDVGVGTHWDTVNKARRERTTIPVRNKGSAALMLKLCYYLAGIFTLISVIAMTMAN